ncbi:MAG: hypothetical protein JOZ24_09445 [Candidatus Eremiobacteraeota bacterium]|nr:hypothetical protein [Candidatus Eremiobacteraeota bacterium]
MKPSPERTIYAARAFFGVGFILLGAIALWRVAVATTPNKGIGFGLGLAMIALGVFRLLQFARYRRTSGS